MASCKRARRPAAISISPEYEAASVVALLFRTKDGALRKRAQRRTELVGTATVAYGDEKYVRAGGLTPILIRRTCDDYAAAIVASVFCARFIGIIDRCPIERHSCQTSQAFQTSRSGRCMHAAVRK